MSEIHISLGYNCFVRVYLQEFLKATPRYPFDWTGTPMWAICELMDSNFSDFNNPEKLVVRKRFMNSDEMYLTNTQYNTVFLHDYGKDPHSITPEQYEKVTEDYKRRIERWNSALNGGDHLVLYRLEQSVRPRVPYEGSSRSKSETEYLWEFTDKLKSRGTHYHVIYITHSTPQGYDAERKIIHLNYTPNKVGMTLMGRHIDAIVKSNKKFIKECLKS